MATDTAPMETETQPSTAKAEPTMTTVTSPDAPPAAPKKSWRPSLGQVTAVVGGLALWVCFHPLAWGWLGWVALVPTLSLVRSKLRTRSVYLLAWLAGSVFFWTALQWMRVADYRMYATWAMLATYCSLYFPAAILLMRLLDRRTRLPLVVTAPLVWVSLEYVRSFLMTGFAWYFLAHTQHDYLAIIQMADFGGVYTVSLLVAAVNALVFDLLYQQKALRVAFQQTDPTADQRIGSWDLLNLPIFTKIAARPNLLIELAAVALLFLAAHTYGMYRLSQETTTQGPLVSLLQGDLDQRIRNDAGGPDPSRDAMLLALNHYSRLCQSAMRQSPLPDLIIWPETSFPFVWHEVSKELLSENVPADWRKAEVWIRTQLQVMSQTCSTKNWTPQHLVGMNATYLDRDKKRLNYNSAVHVNKLGQVAGRFDKMHRVPFGEYVPLRDWLPFMNYFAPYDYDYSVSAGEKFTRFDVGRNKRFGVLICFEDTDPVLARRYAVADSDGPPVDFLVNLSNDGWFDGTAEHETHLAVSRFRAVECRRSMVRSVNMGISAVIDSSGRVLRPVKITEDPVRQAIQNTGVAQQQPLPPIWAVVPDRTKSRELPVSEWGDFKQVDGVISANVPLDTRVSVYSRWGDTFALACCALLALALLRGFLAPRPIPVV